MKQREIKFRVWDKEDNQWVTSLNEKSTTKINYDSRFLVKWNQYVLVQYTGIKDKNGKEIYEGDLIDSYQNDYAPTPVFWDDQLAQFSTQNYHSTLSLVDSMNSKSIVIGNIYENPELCK